MEKLDRKKAEKEWSVILQNHPSFARTFLVQQSILIQSSQLGVRFVDINMCKLIASGLPVLFEDYWKKHCVERVGEIQIDGMIGCLTENHDPAQCFDLSHGWFDDPLAEGRVIPPKPPFPPL